MRKQKTTVTFALTMVLPTGVNINQMQQYVRTAITHWSSAGAGPDNAFHLADEDFTVALKKKETIYA